MTCTSCGAEIHNGQAICHLCQGRIHLVLPYLPIYFRNLARWTPGRAGSRPVPGSRVLYLGDTTHDGTGDRISDRLDDTLTTLHDYAHRAVTDRPYLARLYNRLAVARAEERIDDTAVVTWLCTALDRHLPALATLDWAGLIVTGLTHHEETLRELTEELVPGWYAGACTTCGAGTYALTDLTWVTCRGCGKTDHASAHIDTLLQEARSWVAPLREIAEVVVALTDAETSVPRLNERIRKWATRGHLTPVYRVRRDYAWSIDAQRFVPVDEEAGRPRYRLGDVLDLLIHTTHDRKAKAS